MDLPDILDKDKEVEEILDSKFLRKKLWYYVHWEGLPRSERTWVKRSELIKDDRVKQLITEFHKREPTAPRYHVTIPGKATLLTHNARFMLTTYDTNGQRLEYDTDDWNYWTTLYDKWKDSCDNDTLARFLRHLAFL